MICQVRKFSNKKEAAGKRAFQKAEGFLRGRSRQLQGHHRGGGHQAQKGAA